MDLERPSISLKGTTDTKGRKIEKYAILYPVTLENPNKAKEYVTNKIWLVFNLESTFYSCERLRQVLGLYPGSTALDEKVPITALKLNNVTELSKIGALGEMNCTLRPVKPNTTYGSLGALHKTSFFFTLDKSLQEVATNLRAVKIKIARTEVEYEVVPGSLTLKKQKRTTPHFG